MVEKLLNKLGGSERRRHDGRETSQSVQCCIRISRMCVRVAVSKGTFMTETPAALFLRYYYQFLRLEKN
jgi:hypothetical protein